MSEKKKVRPKNTRMYNPDQKWAYINADELNSDILRRYFCRTRIMEEKFQKDISFMDENELRQTIMSLQIRRKDSIANFLSLMRGYITWCSLKQGVSLNNAINKFTADSFVFSNIVKTKMIESPEQIDDIIDTVYGVDDYNEYDNRCKRNELILRLLYSGMSLKEIKDLSKFDIYIEEKRIYTNNKTKKYNITNEIIELYQFVANMKQIEQKRREEIQMVDLYESDDLFRSDRGKMALNSLGKPISKLLRDYYGVNDDEKFLFPPENIATSGLFYQIFELEQSGINITDEIFAEYFNLDNSKHIKIKSLQRDYLSWKVAFNHNPKGG